MPLPEQARPQLDPAEGYRLQRAGDAGYVVISGFVQSSFVVTSDGIVVVDAPPALAVTALYAEIGKLTTQVT